MLSVISDAVAEGRLAFHPKDFYATARGQEEASAPYIEQYGQERLPKYLDHVEDLIKHANGKAGDELHVVGTSLTTADIAVYHFMCAAEHHYPEHYGAAIQRCPLAKVRR